MRELEREGGRRRRQMALKVISVEMLCRCPQCRGVNKVVVDWNNPKRYHKCQVCDSLIPLGAYRVIMLNNELSNPIF